MVTHRSMLFGALLVLLGLILAACQPIQAPAASSTAPAVETSAEPESATPEATINDVTIIAAEYSFEAPESLPAGWTRVTLENQGELPHDFILFKVEEGRTMEDVMAVLAAEGPPEWAEFFGAASARVGESNWFAANLTPGPYVYLSFGESESGPPDAAQGMIGTLTVTEATGPVPDDAPIEADVSIELVDYQFVINGTFSAGRQVLRVSNTGTELHEIVFFKMNEGMGIEDFMALMEQEMEGEQAPADDEETPADGEETPADGEEQEAGETPEADEMPEDGGAPDEGEMPGEFAGATYLSPGLIGYTTQEFEPGTYVIVCFIPSPEHDMQPHLALGMIREITVE